MHKTAFILLSALALGCAGQTQNTKSINHPKNDSPTVINIANPDGAKSPFKNEAEEKMFWKIMNREIDQEKIVLTPANKIAVILMTALSYDVPDMIRVQAFNLLMAKSSQMMSPATKGNVEIAFDGENLTHRVVALRLIFEYDVEALAILRYVLNDETRMLDFMAKQEAKKEAALKASPKKHNFKPAPAPVPAPSEPPPGQRF